MESVDRAEILVTVGEESEECVLGILDNSVRNVMHWGIPHLLTVYNIDNDI